MATPHSGNKHCSSRGDKLQCQLLLIYSIKFCFLNRMSNNWMHWTANVFWIFFLDYYGKTTINELEIILFINFYFLRRKRIPFGCNPTELEIILLIKSCFLSGHTFPASSLQATPTFVIDKIQCRSGIYITCWDSCNWALNYLIHSWSFLTNN